MWCECVVAKGNATHALGLFSSPADTLDSQRQSRQARIFYVRVSFFLSFFFTSSSSSSVFLFSLNKSIHSRYFPPPRLKSECKNSFVRIDSTNFRLNTQKNRATHTHNYVSTTNKFSVPCFNNRISIETNAWAFDTLCCCDFVKYWTFLASRYNWFLNRWRKEFPQLAYNRHDIQPNYFVCIT